MNDIVQEQLEKLDIRKKDYQHKMKLMKVFSIGLILFEIVSLIIFYISFSEIVELLIIWILITAMALGTFFFMSMLEKKNIEHCEKYLCRRCGIINREVATFCDNCGHKIELN